MDELYRELVLEHYRRPQNFGRLEQPGLEGEDVNPMCGDEQRITMNLDQQGRVFEVAFEGQGCAISTAATSMLTEELLGKTPEQILQINQEQIMEMLGSQVSAQRVKCALLGLNIAQAASSQYLIERSTNGGATVRRKTACS